MDSFFDFTPIYPALGIVVLFKIAQAHATGGGGVDKDVVFQIDADVAD